MYTLLQEEPCYRVSVVGVNTIKSGKLITTCRYKKILIHYLVYTLLYNTQIFINVDAFFTDNHGQNLQSQHVISLTVSGLTILHVKLFKLRM